MSSFTTAVKHMLTDTDNTTYNTGRILAVLVVLQGCVMQVLDFFLGSKSFSMTSFGTGMGGLLAGLGVYLMGDKDKSA